MKNHKPILKKAIFGLVLLFVAYAYFFQRDEALQISCMSGHKRRVVRILNMTVYLKNYDTDLGKLIDRRDSMGSWRDTSVVKYRLSGMESNRMVWGGFEVQLQILIAKWREEGVDLNEQRRMARSFLDEIEPERMARD